MSSPPWIARAGGFAPRLALYYAAYFMGLGVQMPFFPVWLTAKGLEPRTVGLVLALPMFIRLIAVPVMTLAADRHNALRAAIVIGTVATALGYGVTGLMDSAAGILVVFGLFALVYTPTMPMVDAYALRGISQYGGAYGSIRLWGSATFILGSFGTGFLLNVLATQNLIWLIAGGYALTAIVSFSLAPIAVPIPHSATARSARSLLRDPVFLAVIVSASLIQASHSMQYGFATIAWQTAGIDSTTIGVLAAVAVVAEIVMFAVAGKLPAWFGPTTLLRLGAAGAVVRWAGMALNPPESMLWALQCLHALSFAATHLGAMTFLNRAAPPGLAATAQGYYAIVSGITAAAAMASSGVLYGSYGHLGYAVMVAIATAGGLLAIYAHRRWHEQER